MVVLVEYFLWDGHYAYVNFKMCILPFCNFDGRNDFFIDYVLDFVTSESMTKK